MRTRNVGRRVTPGGIDPIDNDRTPCGQQHVVGMKVAVQETIAVRQVRQKPEGRIAQIFG
ncbi:MAG TPA: hypothetical protein VFT63_02595 [bacterium]|nr:hypothetical protein [bacterium]